VLSPQFRKRRHQRVLISRLNHTASVSAAYASSSTLPYSHARLASGCWLSFTGREFNPLDSDERFLSNVCWASPLPRLTLSRRNVGHDLLFRPLFCRHAPAGAVPSGLAGSWRTVASPDVQLGEAARVPCPRLRSRTLPGCEPQTSPIRPSVWAWSASLMFLGRDLGHGVMFPLGSAARPPRRHACRWSRMSIFANP
jgi:hypothetical protein